MAQFKVVLTDFGDPDHSLESEVFKASGLDVDFVRLQARTPEELLPTVADADGLLVQWFKVTPEIMDKMPKCRVISRYGVGVDMIDVAAATARGIIVANVPDFCIDEVSTHTLAFILSLNRHLWEHHQHVKSGKWGGPPGGAPSRLSTQTVGVVALGNIGREVARKVSAFGVKVLGCDPYIKPEKLQGLDVELVGLEELLRRSDYVCIHTPLVEETRHLIGAAQLAVMKPTAYLINVARGPVVDQAALYQALVAGTIRGAALDVLEQEPPSPDDPILKLDNVIFTPHAASWTTEAGVQLRRDTAGNVVTFLQGKLPRAIVNRKGLNLPEA